VPGGGTEAVSERDFWLTIARALKMIVAAIERPA
jgi:hypothetical protein